jgi:dihydroorotate dehydrogenase (NAD+) catalytic subunit
VGGAVDLTTRLARTELPNPIVAASGTFGHGAELAALCPPCRLGAVTAKSVAAFAWPGNPPRRVGGAPGGGMINSVGLTGPGVKQWIASDLPALRAAHARVIASIWGRTIDEFVEAATPLAAVIARACSHTRPMPPLPSRVRWPRRSETCPCS